MLQHDFGIEVLARVDVQLQHPRLVLVPAVQGDVRRLDDPDTGQASIPRGIHVEAVGVVRQVDEFHADFVDQLVEPFQGLSDRTGGAERIGTNDQVFVFQQRIKPPQEADSSSTPHHTTRAEKNIDTCPRFNSHFYEWRTFIFTPPVWHPASRRADQNTRRYAVSVNHQALPIEVLVQAVVAGIAACLACGLGAFPLAIPGLDPARHRGLGYAFAGGLMFAASVYNLILPALQMGQSPDEFQVDLAHMLPILTGMLLGAGFLALTDHFLDHDAEDAAVTLASPDQKQKHDGWGGRVGLLVLIAMTVHSIPEGVAVGTGYTSDAANLTSNLGPVLALAIGIHNIPEGLAVAIPLRAAGASIWRCFWAAVLTSVPQPIAAVPAVLLAWFFQPLMPLLMGFAAGAMIFLIILELIPHALEEEKPTPIAWSFTLGFAAMLLVQVVL